MLPLTVRLARGQVEGQSAGRRAADDDVAGQRAGIGQAVADLEHAGVDRSAPRIGVARAGEGERIAAELAQPERPAKVAAISEIAVARVKAEQRAGVERCGAKERINVGLLPVTRAADHHGQGRPAGHGDGGVARQGGGRHRLKDAGHHGRAAVVAVRPAKEQGVGPKLDKTNARRQDEAAVTVIAVGRIDAEGGAGGPTGAAHQDADLHGTPTARAIAHLHRQHRALPATLTSFSTL